MEYYIVNFTPCESVMGTRAQILEQKQTRGQLILTILDEQITTIQFVRLDEDLMENHMYMFVSKHISEATSLSRKCTCASLYLQLYSLDLNCSCLSVCTTCTKSIVFHSGVNIYVTQLICSGMSINKMLLHCAIHVIDYLPRFHLGPNIHSIHLIHQIQQV